MCSSRSRSGLLTRCTPVPCLACCMYSDSLCDFVFSHQIRYIVETQGQPPDSLLDSGEMTDCFFDSFTSLWKLKVPSTSSVLSVSFICLFVLSSCTVHCMSMLTTALSVQSPEEFHKGMETQLMESTTVKLSPFDALLHVNLFIIHSKTKLKQTKSTNNSQERVFRSALKVN